MARLGWLLLWLQLLVPCCGFCEGEWKSNVDDTVDSYHIAASRIQFDPKHVKKNHISWLQHACPAQSAAYSCYNLGPEAAGEAEKMEQKRFVPLPGSTCKPFRPIDFLNLIRNKRVVVLGDSIASQIYSSLFCTLHPLVETRSFTSFMVDPQACTDYTCIGGDKAHLVAASMTIPSFNASIKLVSTGTVDQMPPLTLIHRHRLTQNDIVIVNWGAHYNDKEHLHKDLLVLRKSLIEGAYGYSPQSPSDSWRKKFPPIFFMEATPQHFPEGGYYRLGQPTNGSCAAYANAQSFAERDWRNSLKTEVFPFLGRPDSPIQVVPLAHGLWDQHDMHVGRFVNVLDCTHWCFPSAMNKFAHLMLYNALLRHLPPPSAPSTTDRLWTTFELREGDVARARGEKDIFLVERATRRPFQNWNAFVGRGFDTADVRVVEASELTMLPVGEPLL